MPAIQTVNLNAPQRTEPTGLEKTLGAFANAAVNNQTQKIESDALSDIYKQYQNDGRNLEKTLFEIQSRPGISPTTRVNTVNQLLKFQEVNQHLKKQELDRVNAENKRLADREAINQMADTYGVPREEAAKFNNPSLFQRTYKPQAGKGPLGGLGGTPPTKEESENIARVVRENPDATAEELELAFNEAGIIPGRVKDVLESRRRKEEREAQERTANKKIERQEQIKFHEETQKFDEELQKNVRVAKNQLQTIEHIKKAVDSGNAGPGSWSNIFKGFGEVGDKVSKALLNEDTAAIEASIPALLEGWKEVFGVRLSDADLKVLQDKLPSASKSKEANYAVLKVLKKYAKINLLRGEIASDIKSRNNNLRPLGYVDQIEKRFDELTKPVMVLNPKTGKAVPIPAYEVGDALKAGGSLVNE